MKRKVLASVWKTTGEWDKIQFVLGFIAVETDAHLMQGMRTWCAYAGVGIGHDKIEDEQLIINIADGGAKLTAQQAHGFFPQLDITRYKTQ